MDAQLWQRVQEVFESASELGAAGRAVYLDTACAGQPELRAEVEPLLEAHDRAGSFIESVPQRIGPYRLAGQIGRGGMGSVYRAERDDGQFRQQVAIKLLSLAGSDTLYRRFQDERQILANLAHPNIARLLDGGVTESGLSYIVMEFVDGERLDRYAEGLPFAEKLGLFRRICSAVQYAHQNLVVHRDLKPANILVTAAGEPKLLDFGIAKMLAPSTFEGGMTAMPVMTPDYASPEQVAGRPLSTASDVYSLGVVLHELLTGRRPYEVAGRTYDELREVICERPIARPGTGCADLDAILVKALRKEPEGRYSSAEAFSEDIGRHVSKLPVRARSGAAWYVLGRLLARRRAALAVGAAVLLLLGAAGAATVRQYRLATRRFEQVRQIARFVAYPIYDAVAALPGSTSARRLILSKTLDYLDKLSPEAGGDQPLQFEIGEAYARLADVQGHPAQPNLGDPMGAIANYRKSLALYRDILRQSPQDSRAIAGLGNVCRRFAVVLISVRQVEEARKLAREAVALVEPLAARHPSEENRTLLAGAYSGLADVTDNDLTYRLKALPIVEELLKAKPGDTARQRNVALANKYIAGQLLFRAEKDRGLGYLNRAEELDAARAAASPEDREAQMDLSFDYSQNATFYSNRERYEEALANYRKALDIRLRIAKADPADARLQDRLVYVYSRVGDTLGRLRRPAEALIAYEEAVRISRKLLAREPRHPQFRSNLATALANEAGLKPDACGSWREAAGLYAEMERDRQLKDSERVKMEQVVTRVRACGG